MVLAKGLRPTEPLHELEGIYLRKEVYAGITLLVLSLAMMLAILVAENISLASYGEEHPTDETGPCAGRLQDQAVCNQLEGMRSLWLVAFALLFLGIGLMGYGFYLSSQPGVVGGGHPVGYPCPTCNRPMTWIPQYQRWFCYSCQRYG